MTKTRIRNTWSKLINIDTDQMLMARTELINQFTTSFGAVNKFCHTLVWQTETTNEKITVTLDSFDCVIEIEDSLTVSDVIIDFKGNWIVAHIDCATNETRELIDRICDIYKVEHIF